MKEKVPYITRYIDRAAKKMPTGSIYRLAIELNVSANTLYRARVKGGLSDIYCLKIAYILDMDPVRVLAAKHADKASSDLLREAWVDAMKGKGLVSHQQRAADNEARGVF